MLKVEEEEEGLGWRGCSCRCTRASTSNTDMSHAGGLGGVLCSALTAAGARATLPTSVEVLPNSSSGIDNCGGLLDVAYRLLISQLWIHSCRAAPDLEARGWAAQELLIAAVRPLQVHTDAGRLRGLGVDFRDL